MPEFDGLAKQVFSNVTALMGESAVWHSSAGKEVTGNILYKNPTEPVQIGDAERYEYRPNTVTIEYYDGTFTGLKEAVDGQKSEYITVRGQKHFVESVTTKFDGKTHIAHLEVHTDEE